MVNVGKYASPMDSMGLESVFLFSSFIGCGDYLAAMEANFEFSRAFAAGKHR